MKHTTIELLKKLVMNIFKLCGSKYHLLKRKTSFAESSTGSTINQNGFCDISKRTIEKFSASGKQICVLGDYNLDALKIESSRYSHDFLMSLQISFQQLTNQLE